MGHVHFPNSFSMFGINQRHDENHINPEHCCIPMVRAAAPENGPVVCPLDNMIRSGMNCDSQSSAGRMVNEYPSPSFSVEVSHVPPAFTVSPYGPFPQSSAAGSIHLASENSAGYYNGPIVHETEIGLIDSTVGNARGPFKRKSRDISGSSEMGSTSRFYGAGSSSGTSEVLLEKPTLTYPNPGPTGLPQHRGDNLSIAGEDCMRNVRRCSRLDFDPNTIRSHFSSYSSPHFMSTTQPMNHSGMVDLANISGDGSTREWNCFPISSTVTSDTNGSRHETGQFIVGASPADIVGCQYDSVSSRPPNLLSQVHHGSPPQTAMQSHIHFAQRTMPAYRPHPNHSRFGNEATSLDSDIHSLSESSRYTRPLSASGWRGSNRNGRSRMTTERFQSISIVLDAQERMGSEPPMMVDHSAFYGSRNLFDQYRDMRLDVDGMSYEELLALGEQIGNVSTGLSKDMISKCLIEKMHHSRGQDEEKCAICLEEYKNKEAVGIIKNCGHDYHASCIRKWLLMKNVCPICKTAALAECAKPA